MLPIYRTMLETRAFDMAALRLQRTGGLGTYASPLGQEAIGAGVASVMRGEDLLVPSYREFSAQLWRGVTMIELLLYWGGDRRGSRKIHEGGSYRTGRARKPGMKTRTTKITVSRAKQWPPAPGKGRRRLPVRMPATGREDPSAGATGWSARAAACSGTRRP